MGVVENHSDREARTARWLFPLYLVLINLFVVPVALAGMLQFGQSVSSDNFVLALPLANDARSISLLVFVGGLSAATAMVIVACVALAIMLSNNIVLPLLLQRDSRSAASDRDMAPLLLNIRRTAIFCILAMAYAYFQAAGDSAALASIGLLSFAAIAQFAPAFFGGLFWQRANTRGALWGMCVGFAMWFYTLFLPTLFDPAASFLTTGPLDLNWLRPQALFDLEMAPLTHGVVLSLGINCIGLVLGSLSRPNKSIERMQANAFWFFGGRTGRGMVREGHSISVGELQAKVANYLGQERCDRAFEIHGQRVGRLADSRETADDDLMHLAEQLLASAIGAASSRLVISLMLQKRDQTTESTMQLLDDASEALQQNRDTLQTAIDQVEQGISVFDAEFRLSSWNRRFRELLQLPADIGQAGTPLSHVCLAIAERCEWRSDGTTDFVKRLLEVDLPWQVILKNSKRIIEISTKALPVGGHVISWHDMTERVNAANALQLANETLERRVEERTRELTRLNDDLALAREGAEAANIGKTKFLAAVGHDILQPLNAARLYASSLVEQLENDPAKKLASNVDESLESVEDILGAVLAISRLDSGVLTPNTSDFSIDALFQRLEVEFKPTADAKRLSFNVIRSDFAVHSDFNLLHRLLQNLVSNAIKYTRKGSVTLDSKVRGNKLVFIVTDTGHGIATLEQEAAFREFKRLDAGKETANGLGLGLSIVKRLAETLNHKLELQSIVNAGTTFSIEVPLARGVVSRVAPNEREASTAKNLAGLNVICIDNEPRILDGMVSLLSGWGCHVSCFETTLAMMAELKELDPAILIADYHLERETGLDAIEAARTKLGNGFAAVLITADRSAAVRQAARAADVSLLNKPLKPAALRAILARQLLGAQTEPVTDAAQ